MPSYTMELWRLIDLKPDTISEDEWLGLHDYPLFDPDYRYTLNTKIKRHYMYQEIGSETVEQFRFFMLRKMHEIMPLYNELYRTTRLEFDPLATVSLRTLVTGEAEQTAEGKSVNDSEGEVKGTTKNVVSNFPQVMLAGNKDYASNGADGISNTDTRGTATEETESSNKTQQKNESVTTGYQGIPGQILQAYRSAILNVDMLIIAELTDLFMIVWNNSDDYSTTKGRVFY